MRLFIVSSCHLVTRNMGWFFIRASLSFASSQMPERRSCLGPNAQFDRRLPKSVEDLYHSNHSLFEQTVARGILKA